MNTITQTSEPLPAIKIARRGHSVSEITKCLRGFNRNITGPFSAHAFIPLLENTGPLDFGDKIALRFTERGSIVLLENEFLKVTLIYWAPGKTGKIHGHPQGGCMFKLLEGRLEEKRFASLSSSDPFETHTYTENGMAYIHDTMAYHAVGNPFEVPAYSIHMYSK